MGALSSAKRAGTTVIRNPILFLAAGTFALVQAPQVVLQGVGLEIVASFFSMATVLVTPFLLGGTYGMATEALDGTTSFDTFFDAGRENYVTLLVSGIFFSVVVFVVVFVAMLVMFAVALFTVDLGSLSSGQSVASLVPLLVVGGLFSLLYLVASLLLQFYEAAIVVDDADVFESFERSYSFVTVNVLSTIGFTLVQGTLGLLTVAVTAFYVLTSIEFDATDPGRTATVFGSMYQGLPQTALVTIVAVSVVSTVVLGAFTRTYLIAFYAENRTERTTDTDELFDEEYRSKV